MTNRTGQQLGNYHLIRLLGAGGFGEVYLGEQKYLKTQAAIKILLKNQLTDQEKPQFYEEARTITKLKHDNIVRIIDFGEEDNVPYMIMEYAPHGTLRERYPKDTPTKPSLADTVSYIKQIAEGLQYAHDVKIIHRDIKPENMLVGQDDKILLSDFGLAVIARSEKSRRMQDQTGQDQAGTAQYMAPEQFRGKAAPASDQYSLAVTAYEWLCGAPPFYEGNGIQLGYQHAYEPVPAMGERGAVVSTEVEQVIMKALEKDPAKRFGSVKEFAERLEQASRVKPSVDPPPPPSSKWVALLLTLVLVFGVVISGSVWLFHTGNQPVPTPVITHTPLSQATIAATPTPTPDTLLTAEAGHPAYHNVLTSASTQKGDWQNDRYCFFASDGYHVAFAGAFAICHQSGKVPYQDVTISIDMVLNGGTGGLLFRDQGTFGAVGAYVFELAPDGRYKISVLTPIHGTIINRPLLDWTFSTALHQGVKVVNTLQIITIGNDFLFYMNGIYLTRRTDKSYIDGGISLACYDSGEAIFSNLSIYYR